MTKIMIIRHAEKPGDGCPHRGVTYDGLHDKHELTVHGWQRAGALVRYFAPVVPFPADSLIATPRSIFASAATLESPSLRAQRTTEPLAASIGIDVDLSFANGDEEALAAAARAVPGPVLIAWHHHRIVRLTKMIGGHGLHCPHHWPDDRFDVVWVLDLLGPDGPWRFSQVPQCLIAGDSPEPIPKHRPVVVPADHPIDIPADVSTDGALVAAISSD